MKTQILAAIFLVLFNTNAFAQTSNTPAPHEPSSQTERNGLITAKRVIIGTALTLAATIAGYYYLAKPEMRMLAPKKVRNILGGGGAIANLPQQDLPEQHPQDFPKDPVLAVVLPQGRQVQRQQDRLDNEADFREATDLSLAIANSLKDQEPEIKEESKEPIIKAEEKEEKKKKRVRPNGYLLTNNLCTFIRIDDPAFKYTCGSTITISGQAYEPVNSNTDLTNLSIHHAFIDPSEIIVINSETALMLEVIYEEMLFLYAEQYPNGSTPEQFFAFLIKFIRSTGHHVFDANRPGSKSQAVNELIKEISSNQNITQLRTTTQDRVIPLINLLQYLKTHVGVCRHYSLVLAYLAQRFIKEPGCCLSGGSAHISAGRVQEDGHVWVVYIDPTGHEGFHIDALWDLNLPLCLGEQQPLDSSLLERLTTADREQFLEDSVDYSQNNVLQNSEPQWGMQGGIYSFSISEDEEVKEDAEVPEWMKRSLDLGDKS